MPNHILVIPKHLQIETINGVCSARCKMCTINKWTRKPHRMTQTEFEVILNKFIPYIHYLDYLTLHGCGEPLLDKELPNKIKFAKQSGFHGVGFATNCTELNPNTSERLIGSGLDTIICSIDGIKKETHESIRIGTNYEKVVENAKYFIRLRDQMKRKTRVLIRFIRQEMNYAEWSEYYDHWQKYISPEKGDDIIRFDMHNWGKGEHLQNQPDNDSGASTLVCSDIFARLSVYSNGQMGFCCADDNGFFNLGSLFNKDPIEIYNSEPFLKYRTYMQEGKMNQLDPCNKCTIPLARANIINPLVMKNDQTLITDLGYISNSGKKAG